MYMFLCKTNIFNGNYNDIYVFNIICYLFFDLKKKKHILFNNFILFYDVNGMNQVFFLPMAKCNLWPWPYYTYGDAHRVRLEAMVKFISLLKSIS